MRPTLYESRHRGYSQFGEEGMIAECLKRLDIVPMVGRIPTCMEFGAADGLMDSNTAALWRNDVWTAVLYEADAARARALNENCAAHPNTIVRHAKVDDVDAVLASHHIDDLDLLSIDVDGDDYLIWDRCQMRPPLVVIEYNPSVPPRVDVRPEEPGGCFGASAAALCRLAATKGYDLVGLTEANLFFVITEQSHLFGDLECRLEALMAPFAFILVATDQIGRPLMLIDPNRLYWGFKGFDNPVTEPLVFGR